jgi:hypothetical protein
VLRRFERVKFLSWRSGGARGVCSLRAGAEADPECAGGWSFAPCLGTDSLCSVSVVARELAREVDRQPVSPMRAMPSARRANCQPIGHQKTFALDDDSFTRRIPEDPWTDKRISRSEKFTREQSRIVRYSSCFLRICLINKKITRMYSQFVTRTLLNSDQRERCALRCFLRKTSEYSGNTQQLIFRENVGSAAPAG